MPAFNTKFCAAVDAGNSEELHVLLQATATELARSAALRSATSPLLSSPTHSPRREEIGTSEPRIWPDLVRLWKLAAEDAEGGTVRVLLLAKFTRNLVAGCTANQDAA
jgi:hypothetical protein